MFSIGNATTADELREFDVRVRKLLGKEKIRYVVEPMPLVRRFAGNAPAL